MPLPDKIPPINLRLRRAQQLTAQIMQELPDAKLLTHEDIYQTLVEVFHRNGACIETDSTREDENKLPRDAEGWTSNERLQMEREATRLSFSRDPIKTPK